VTPEASGAKPFSSLSGFAIRSTSSHLGISIALHSPQGLKVSIQQVQLSVQCGCFPPAHKGVSHAAVTMWPHPPTDSQHLDVIICLDVIHALQAQQ
jgi:hypothetical protein